MKAKNEFDGDGNFVLWTDDIGCGLHRTIRVPQRVVQALLWWVLDDGKDYGLFPMWNIERHVWGDILASFREMQKGQDCLFEVLDTQLKEQANG